MALDPSNSSSLEQLAFKGLMSSYVTTHTKDNWHQHKWESALTKVFTISTNILLINISHYKHLALWHHWLSIMRKIRPRQIQTKLWQALKKSLQQNSWNWSNLIISVDVFIGTIVNNIAQNTVITCKATFFIYDSKSSNKSNPWWKNVLWACI